MTEPKWTVHWNHGEGIYWLRNGKHVTGDEIGSALNGYEKLRSTHDDLVTALERLIDELSQAVVDDVLSDIRHAFAEMAVKEARALLARVRGESTGGEG